MTDETDRWGAPEVATPPAAPWTPAGWYPDPWSQGHHRYWDGSGWTGGSFPHGPANPWSGEGTDAAEIHPPLSPPPTPPPAGRDPAPPPPPEWSSPSPFPTWPAPAPPIEWGPAVTTEAPSKRSPWLSGTGFVALVIGVMIVVGSFGTLGGYLAFRHRSSPRRSASGPPPGVSPTVPVDRSAAALDSLVLNQADVPSSVVVQPNPDSGQFSADAPTLDLCNGTFPSESLRTARVQVTAFDGTASPLLSTEAVLYTNPAATEQAFGELKSVATNCPSTPVVSPVGEPPAVFQFNAPPDGSWAATPTVNRLAYDFVSTDEVGSAHHAVAVYLRRGRVLMGVYFSAPDAPQITVAGQSSIEQIVGVFAGRMAALPASVVNG